MALPRQGKRKKRKRQKRFGTLRLRLRVPFQSFGLGGGSSRATTASVKPWWLWLPSQKGLFVEWPQRHNEITVRPASPNTCPLGSQISNSPSIRKGPLVRGVILVDGTIQSYRKKAKVKRQRTKVIRSALRFTQTGAGTKGCRAEGRSVPNHFCLLTFLFSYLGLLGDELPVAGAALSSTTSPYLMVDLPSYFL